MRALTPTLGTCAHCIHATHSTQTTETFSSPETHCRIHIYIPTLAYTHAPLGRAGYVFLAAAVVGGSKAELTPFTDIIEVHPCVCERECASVCLSIYLFVSLCLCLCMCTCVVYPCVCVCVCMSVCVCPCVWLACLVS